MTQPARSRLRTPPLRSTLSALGLLAVAAAVSPAVADEGMWTVSDFPRDKVQKKYGFTPSDAWLRSVQLGAVRLSNGCSGSFVSPSGLVMTNHHCAVGCIGEHSTAQRDLLSAGFSAAQASDERRCSGLELNQLLEIEDVTPRVLAATKGLDGQQFGRAQRAEISRLEKACSEATKLRCDVVTLYHGGRYHLYKYRRYSDVRLVFAPESGMASFGGDPDNFNYPRFALDAAFLRAYENGQPVRSDNFFKFNPAGASEGEVIFAVGHPGTTQRLLTVDQLEFLRDVALPDKLLYLAEQRGQLTEFGRRGVEEKRIAAEALQYLENSFKAISGQHKTLLDKDFMAQKVAAERGLRAQIARDPALQQRYGGAWDAIASAQKEGRRLYRNYVYLEASRGFNSSLFKLARTLLRGAEERKKPSEERLREFHDTALPSLVLKLYNKHPIYPRLEELTLTYSLTKLREAFGPDHPVVRQVLGNQSPADVAHAAVSGSKLADVATRQALWDGGAAAVQRSTDPMLVLARAIDAEARKVRKQYEDAVESIEDKQGELVAQSLFSVLGTSLYPDATFTLRISFGTPKGYREKEDDREIPTQTLIGGAFSRHTGRDPFVLPSSWLAKKGALKLDTPFNFVSTLDIIGGNSGSPVLDRSGRIVGLAFDGNLQSLGGAYYFDEARNRCVSLHSAGLLEALRGVYRAERLLKELVVESSPAGGATAAGTATRPLTVH